MKKTDKKLKKLELHRETVRLLNEDDLGNAAGGIRDTWSCLTCPSSPVVC